MALALRVEVSLILFQTRPPESCFFTISSTLVPQNAPQAVDIDFLLLVTQTNGNLFPDLILRENSVRLLGLNLMGFLFGFRIRGLGF